MSSIMLICEQLGCFICQIVTFCFVSCLRLSRSSFHGVFSRKDKCSGLALNKQMHFVHELSSTTAPILWTYQKFYLYSTSHALRVCFDNPYMKYLIRVFANLVSCKHCLLICFSLLFALLLLFNKVPIKALCLENIKRKQKAEK